MINELGRRDFLAATAAGVGALAMRPPVPQQAVTLFRAPPLDRVRVGFVGVGHQGSSHVENFLRLDGVEVRAICDLVPAKVQAMQELVVAAGQPQPAAYHRGPDDYRRMCDEAELDLVFTATPWHMHAPVCAYAMETGKHAATEVPMAPTLEELWMLVETAERTRRHCVMMENCCYDRTEMMLFNMIRHGLFGELLHARCGYRHDLRELKLTDYYEENWRVWHSIHRNGDLYPTHGLGPVAQWMNVNRGNRFATLVSMATPARGLNQWAAEHLGAGSDYARQPFALGDIATSLIQTEAGSTILVTHDTNLPRPYSRDIEIQGTHGTARKYPEQKVHIEGRSPPHRWEDLTDYRAEWEHPLWKTLEEQSRGAGHGGMDYIEDYRLVWSLRNGAPTDMDVYDGAAVSSVSAMSERSIAAGSAPQEMPDFTRGAWRNRPPLGIVEAGDDIGGVR